MADDDYGSMSARQLRLIRAKLERFLTLATPENIAASHGSVQCLEDELRKIDMVFHAKHIPHIVDEVWLIF